MTTAVVKYLRKEVVVQHLYQRAISTKEKMKYGTLHWTEKLHRELFQPDTKGQLPQDTNKHTTSQRLMNLASENSYGDFSQMLFKREINFYSSLSVADKHRRKNNNFFLLFFFPLYALAFPIAVLPWEQYRLSSFGQHTVLWSSQEECIEWYAVSKVCLPLTLARMSLLLVVCVNHWWIFC